MPDMNWIYQKLEDDLLQSKYNLKKQGLYVGRVKHDIEDLLYVLKEEKENAKEIKIEIEK